MLMDLVKREVVSWEANGIKVTRTTPENQIEVKPAKDAKVSNRAKSKLKRYEAVAAAEKATRSKIKKTVAPKAGGSSKSNAARPPAASTASVIAGGMKCTKPAPAADKDAVREPVHKMVNAPVPKGALPTEPAKRVVKAEPPSPILSASKGKPADDAVQAEGQGDCWKMKKKSAAEAPARVDGKQGKASFKMVPGPLKSISVRPLDAIREEARSTVSDRRTFCLQPKSKVSKDSGLKILD